MGHKWPLGLPTSKKWEALVNDLIDFPDKGAASLIAKKIAENVSSKFDDIFNDDGIKAITEFLVVFGQSFSKEQPIEYLNSKGIKLKKDLTPINVSIYLKNWIIDKIDSHEYATIGQEAAVKAILKWYETKETGQQEIFTTVYDKHAKWRALSTGTGFCELIKLYYGNFIDKYLKYFLDREATNVIKNINHRNKLDKDITKHAYEVASITQAFAAGWFQKRIDKDIKPSEIRNYTKLSFEKLREALKQEVQ